MELAPLQTAVFLWFATMETTPKMETYTFQNRVFSRMQDIYRTGSTEPHAPQTEDARYVFATGFCTVPFHSCNQKLRNSCYGI